jgi:catechol 2,3-dioxygenase-like lactoylglutathione lyase family enzyme
MADLALGMVQINVVDLAEAWAFYVDRLGLRPVGSYREGRPFRLAVPGAPSIVIYPVTERVVGKYPDGTGVVLVFTTSDLEVTIASWKTKNVELVPVQNTTHPLGIGDSPVGAYIAFRDPSGNIHELLQPGSQPA